MPGPLFLAQISTTDIATAAIAFIAGAVLCYFMMGMLRGQSLARAKSEAEQLRTNAQNEARTLTDKARLDADRIALERRTQFESEQERHRAEIRETEKRLTKREDMLDQKLETITQKEQELTRQTEAARQRDQALAKKTAELDDTLRQQKDKLLQIAGMSLDDAKRELLQRVEEDCRLESAKIVAKLVEESQAEAKKKAQEITLMAVQRYASEHTTESTVRAVAIPSDDMKGRIIGREGRNIRAIRRPRALTSSSTTRRA